MINGLKIRWLVFLLLLGCIWWLVVRDLMRSGSEYHLEHRNDFRASSGLECVYNCEHFDEVTQ